MSDHIAGFSELKYPPTGFTFVGHWGYGHIFISKTGLKIIVDCELKADNNKWFHVSYSRKNRVPDHSDTLLIKKSFIGERYAYAVFPPSTEYVNIHKYCLHLWTLCNGSTGKVLPEFSAPILEWKLPKSI